MSTQQITKAMKMVSAAKLRRAQEKIVQMRPYSQKLTAILNNVSSAAEGDEDIVFAVKREMKKVLLVPVTSDKGLCGAFNTNIVRLARKKAEELRGAGKTVKFYTIGKKGKDQLARTYRNDIIHSIEPGDLGKLTFADVQGWGEDLTARFEASEFDVAHLLFSKFVSVLTQEPTAIQLMPVAVATDGTVPSVGASVEYEPDEEEILADLLPRNVSVQLLRANRENAASEQGSKMTAMDNATRNAGDMINRLTIQYNRTRQAAITTELIEIIAGAEAL